MSSKSSKKPVTAAPAGEWARVLSVSGGWACILEEKSPGCGVCRNVKVGECRLVVGTAYHILKRVDPTGCVLTSAVVTADRKFADEESLFSGVVKVIAQSEMSNSFLLTIDPVDGVSAVVVYRDHPCSPRHCHQAHSSFRLLVPSSALARKTVSSRFAQRLCFASKRDSNTTPRTQRSAHNSRSPTWRLAVWWAFVIHKWRKALMRACRISAKFVESSSALAVRV